MEQTWPNFPLGWTTLVEMQKIRSMVNFHPWTSLTSWPSGGLFSPHAHPFFPLCLLCPFFPSSWIWYPKVPCVPAHGGHGQTDLWSSFQAILWSCDNPHLAQHKQFPKLEFWDGISHKEVDPGWAELQMFNPSSISFLCPSSWLWAIPCNYALISPS